MGIRPRNSRYASGRQGVRPPVALVGSRVGRLPPRPTYYAVGPRTAPVPPRQRGRGTEQTGNRGERGLGPIMTMTDPIADMLTRLRNANSAYHDNVAMPSSKIKSHIAEILQQEGYISGWKVEEPQETRSARSSTSSSSSARTASARSPASSGSASRACGSTQSPPTCRRCSAAWAWRSSPRPTVSSPASRPARRAWAGKSSPTSGNRERRYSNVAHRTAAHPGSRRRGRHHRWPDGLGEGPQGLPHPHRRRADRDRQGRGRHSARHPPERRASCRRPCTACPARWWRT